MFRYFHESRFPIVDSRKSVHYIAVLANIKIDAFYLKITA